MYLKLVGCKLSFDYTSDTNWTAGIVHCPSEISIHSQCYQNTTWTSSLGWTTTLSANFREVNVAYSKLNGSILSYDFTSAATLAPINATQMLQGYRDAFGLFKVNEELVLQLTNPNSTNLFPLFAYPAFVAACLKGVDSLGAQNPALVTRAADALQCLLAIMLYYCQPSLFARAVSRSSAHDQNMDPAIAQFEKDLLAIAPPDTQVSVAGLHYQIVVGRATLIAYVAISGTALLLSLGVLLYGSISSLGRRVPKTTPFPFLDSAIRCEDAHNGAREERGLDTEVLEGSSRRLMKEISGIELKLVSP
jgi:hypothetical protein